MALHNDVSSKTTPGSVNAMCYGAVINAFARGRNASGAERWLKALIDAPSLTPNVPWQGANPMAWNMSDKMQEDSFMFYMILDLI